MLESPSSRSRANPQLVEPEWADLALPGRHTVHRRCRLGRLADAKTGKQVELREMGEELAANAEAGKSFRRPLAVRTEA